MPTPRYPNILIIDGHGGEYDADYDFVRPTGTQCEMYSFVAQGVGIKVTQSELIIRDAINGSIRNNYSDYKTSRIRAGGGGKIRHRLLQGQHVSPAGALQWQLPIPPTWNVDQVDVASSFGGTVPVLVYYNQGSALGSPRTIAMIEPGNGGNLLFADLISHRYFATRQFTIVWSVCRSSI